MRKKLPEVGDRRIVKYFALFPVVVDHELRWMERVIILQTRQHGHDQLDFWENLRFIDLPAVEEREE